MTCEEAQEFITALVDGELRDTDRASLESHLRGCPGCRAAVEQERLLKQTIRGRAERMSAPRGLRERILADQRIFPERTAKPWYSQVWPLSRPAGAALAAAVMFAIALPLFFRLVPPSEPIAEAALKTHDLVAQGELEVRRTDNPDEVVKELTQAVGGHFHPMGYDLTPMQMRPVAGLVREIQGRKVLVAIYEGAGGTLFCYTFFGSEKDAPTSAAKFIDSTKKVNFYAFSRGEINAVLHREGDLVCILASKMPMDELLALAKSKAKPS
ncbi:MAG TPA: zf-HC2 domain-containing protein [Candidatus Binatia bacterium]|nr:zf-HC2 domain-containing protein [Candidatus Binatia bacterium]